MRSDAQRLALMAAVLVGAVALFVAGFLIVLGVRSVVAEPGSAPPASPPNPGHSWSEIGDLPGTMWHSNNDGSGSGLDADTLDGLQSTEIQDADDYVSNAGYCTAAGTAGDADTLDGQHASAFASASHSHDDRYYTETELQTGGSASVHWDNLSSVPAGFADDIDNDILGGLSCANGQIAKWNGSAWQCAADDTGAGSFWSLTGNSGTTGSNFLGTTDNQALELRVNNARALRLEPNATSPNLIGGYAGNYATQGVVGATIDGGGAYGWRNEVTADYGTVGGGRLNGAEGVDSTVAGGYINFAGGQGGAIGGGLGNSTGVNYSTVAGGYYNQATSGTSTVGGGYSNTASSNPGATVAGGNMNTASGLTATVGGGDHNVAGGYWATVSGGSYCTANGYYATVPGGRDNSAGGHYSFAAGRRAKANHQGSFVWADSTDADFASTTADQFLVRASGGVGLNVTSGGLRLEPNATSPNVIGGYSGNSVTSGAYAATIGGGGDGLGGNANSVTDAYGTVGGGLRNQAGDNAGTVTDRIYATVGGGYANSARGWVATVGGGWSNTAAGSGDTVGGGRSNTASGGYATVAGGYTNTADGYYATVPGGYTNSAAGDSSFAAGRQAKANNQGCFVWGDSTNADVACNNDNRFVARASGGVYLYTTSDLSTGSYLAAGSGSWSSVSDRNLKDNFTSVDGQDVLASLAEIPMTTWNYKAQDASIRHMGPVAQDFYAAFGLGEGETAISTVDADGVALAAIQGLYQLSQEQDARIQALEAQNASLQGRLDDLEARVTALEGGAGANGSSTAPLSSAMPAGWLLLGGLAVLGLVLAQRRLAGGRP